MPTLVTLENAVPHPQSLRWKMGEAYYARCGISAWTGGHVPYRATNNYAVVRQHALLAARLFVELSESGALAPDEDLVVLEVAAGWGMFAQNFFRALRASCGEAGRELLPRLRYVMSDYGEPSIRQASARPELAPLVAEGRVVPALFDLRRPDELWDLERKPLGVTPAMVIANYICDVCPPTVIRKQQGGYLEMYGTLRAEVADGEMSLAAAGGETHAEAIIRRFFDDPVSSTLLPALRVETTWRPVSLEERFPGAGGLHARVIAAALARFEVGTLLYPTSFIELLVGLAPRMKPGGLAVVNDYGSCEDDDLEGAVEPKAQRYGNALAHGVNFSIFDVLAAESGWSPLRTRNPVRTLHTVALRFAKEVSGSFRNTFHRAFKRREVGEDLLDFRDAGKGCFDRGEFHSAIRFYRRCLRIDPDSAQTLYALGEACLEGGFVRLAYRHLKRGHERYGAKHDYDFLLGRACSALGRTDEAMKWYQTSLAREAHHVTLTNLAVIHRSRGDIKQAYQHAARALAMKADYEQALWLIQEIKDAWLKQLAE